jgi:hypothetical protein
MQTLKKSGVLLGILLLTTAGGLLSAAAAGAQEKTEISAFAVNLGGAITSSKVYITIDRWSTPEERLTLVKAFKEGGQEALLKALQAMPKVGFINVPDTLAYDLRYAYKFPRENGGTTMMIGTDRKIMKGELWDQTRSLDYPFELIQLELDAQGKGEGTFSWATNIRTSKDGSHIELEGYANGPVMLTNVIAKVKKGE